MRLYSALCSLLEAYAEAIRTDTLEHEFETADWTEGED